jgi:hypothetical protein
MRKSLLLSLLLSSAVLLPAAGDIRVEPGATRPGSINAFNSRLEIAGRVGDSVFLLGGSLQLSGEVSNDVICIGSRVVIGAGARIGRDLIVIGGRVDRAPGCTIGGEFFHVRTREDLKRISRTILPFLPQSGGLNFFRVSKIFFWFILVMLALAALPGPVRRAADVLKKAPLRCGATGLLSMLVFLVGLLVFTLLSLVLIGIPLLLALLLLYFLLLVFGRTVVFYVIGARIAPLVRSRDNPSHFVALGAVLYALLKVLPWAGAPLLVLMDLFAIGVGVAFFLERRKSIN